MVLVKVTILWRFMHMVVLSWKKNATKQEALHSYSSIIFMWKTEIYKCVPFVNKSKIQHLGNIQKERYRCKAPPAFKQTIVFFHYVLLFPTILWFFVTKFLVFKGWLPLKNSLVFWFPADPGAKSCWIYLLSCGKPWDIKREDVQYWKSLEKYLVNSKSNPPSAWPTSSAYICFTYRDGTLCVKNFFLSVHFCTLLNWSILLQQ